MKKSIFLLLFLPIVSVNAQDLIENYRKYILNSPNNVSLFQSNSTNGIWASGIINDDRWGVFEDATSSKEWFSILSGGSIGINTTTPVAGTKLTVVGHVNIGGTGNHHLRTRHIDGKETNTSEIDDLYLNYNTGKNVRVGFGSTNTVSNLLVAGRLGLGITNPAYPIDVLNVYETTDDFLRFRVSDAPGDYLSIFNTTGTPGQFIPVIKGYHITDNRFSMQMIGATSDENDNGTNALINFDARRNNSLIVNRPLFVWTNYSTKMMTLLANGSLGIGTTTTGPHKLAVEGSIGAREIKVQATGWSDFVFENTYTLPTLEEVELHIKEKGHLKNIPSAKDVEENGIFLAEMDSKLLQKIEELTLYAIEQEKEINELKKVAQSNEELKNKIAKLEILVEQLINDKK